MPSGTPWPSLQRSCCRVNPGLCNWLFDRPPACLVVLPARRYTGALPAAQLLYARALFLNASYDAASRKAGDLLRVNPGLVAGHLLVAKAALQQVRRAGRAGGGSGGSGEGHLLVGTAALQQVGKGADCNLWTVRWG